MCVCVCVCVCARAYVRACVCVCVEEVAGDVSMPGNLLVKTNGNSVQLPELSAVDRTLNSTC